MTASLNFTWKTQMGKKLARKKKINHGPTWADPPWPRLSSSFLLHGSSQTRPSWPKLSPSYLQTLVVHAQPTSHYFKAQSVPYHIYRPHRASPRLLQCRIMLAHPYIVAERAWDSPRAYTHICTSMLKPLRNIFVTLKWFIDVRVIMGFFGFERIWRVRGILKILRKKLWFGHRVWVSNSVVSLTNSKQITC